MAEQWNTQYTQNPGQYPPYGANQAQFPSGSTSAYFPGAAGHVGMDNGAAAYHHTGNQSSGHFHYPRDNVPAKRYNDLAQFNGTYQQAPGGHGEYGTQWQAANQGVPYQATVSNRYGVPNAPLPPGAGGAGIPGGEYFGPGTEYMSGVPSSPMNQFAEDDPNFMEIQTTTDGKRYRCKCGHETKTVGDMTRHHETSKHSSEARYACPCGKRYFRKDGLTRHEKTCPKRGN